MVAWTRVAARDMGESRDIGYILETEPTEFVHCT